MNVKNLWNQAAERYSRLIDVGNGTYHNHLVPAVLDIVCSKGNQIRVLDVGCGEGYLTNQISKRGCEVVGVDISGELIKLAKQKYQNLNFFEVNASMISEKIRGKFEVIVSNFSVHDMKEEDFKLFLYEAKKKLNKDGLLVFSLPHPCFYNKSSLEYFQNSKKCVEITDYINHQEFKKDIGGGVEAKHFHRPLDWYFNNCFMMDYECVGFQEIFDDNNKSFKKIPFGLILSFAKRG